MYSWWKMFIFIGVKDGSGVNRIFVIGISGVILFGVTGWVTPSVTANGIPGSVALIYGAVAPELPSVTSVIPVIFSVDFYISFLK